MKILALRFKNLNSLYGEWTIDFTTPEYSSNGIFAITGPTGAGKSTILDAICLALYGATPRLGKISKSSNELMSQQTGECFAEVTFQSQTGTFRCHWSQQRARKKADGKLGESTHEISDALTGQLLESKKRDVAAVIEAKTGMDFERFTRSIMLAQGGFSAFLTASADERAPILEQITGTEIYSDISKRVHEQTREQKEQHKLLLAQISNVTVLTDEQVAECQLAITTKQQQQEQVDIELNTTKQALTWLTQIKTLQHELALIAEDSVALNAQFIPIQNKKRQLLLSQNAVELQGLHTPLTLLRQQQQTDEQLLTDTTAQLPALSINLEQYEEEFTKAQHHCTQLKQDHKILARTIQQVRALDQQLQEQLKTSLQTAQECESIAQRIQINKKHEHQFTQQLNCLELELQQRQNYLAEHAHDALLLSQFAAIEEQATRVNLLQKDVLGQQDALSTMQQQVNKAEETVATYDQHVLSQQQNLSGIQTTIKEHKHQLHMLLGPRLLREYRSDKDNLLREMAFLYKIASLESERQKLLNGTPCPLCGSASHPYAQDNVPTIGATEQKVEDLTVLIEAAELHEQQISRLEEQEKSAIQKVTLTEQQKAAAVNQHEHKQRELAEALRYGAKLHTEHEQLKQDILTKVAVFGIKLIPDTGCQQLLIELKQRLKLWQSKQQQQLDCDKQLAAVTSDLKACRVLLTADEQALAHQQSILQQQSNKNRQLQLERSALFGTKDPGTEETLMEATLAAAEQAVQKAQQQGEQTKQRMAAYTVTIKNLNTQINARTLQLQTAAAEFNHALSHKNFQDETAFMAHLLAADARDRLIKEIDSFELKKTELGLKAQDRQQRLNMEEEKQLTESKAEELEPLLIDLQQALTAIKQEIAMLTVDLNNHHANKQKIATQQLLIARQQVECSRLEKLHQLIGSVDGKKYRNFAQGLTFELMVSHANQQLARMTERYLLVRDGNRPLELNVVDNYQAGEIRTTKNLSGGEGFIVSLALALGLSKMSSQKVRVDSLFLDEGFGTLDDEALETALQTLSQLQQDGKIIGVISHVPALKERISTQISVQPLTGGRSAISGPGCMS